MNLFINVECLQYEYLESLGETAFACCLDVIRGRFTSVNHRTILPDLLAREEIFSRGHSRFD